MNKEMVQIFDSPIKRSNETNHMLAKLWRSVLCDLNIRLNQWDKALNRYYRSPFSRVKKNARDIASDKNNFNRALAKDKISWNNFYKACSILGPKKIRLDLVLTNYADEEVVISTWTDNPMAIIDEQDDYVEIDYASARRRIADRMNRDKIKEMRGESTHVSVRQKVADKKNQLGKNP